MKNLFDFQKYLQQKAYANKSLHITLNAENGVTPPSIIFKGKV